MQSKRTGESRGPYRAAPGFRRAPEWRTRSGSLLRRRSPRHAASTF